MTFLEKLAQAQQTQRSWVCVGLDPVMDKLPASAREADNPFLVFGLAIVEATADLVCAFKPNLAFWLTEGTAGLAALKEVVAAVPRHIPVVLDAKFNDIGNTAAAYARFAFEALNADACTVNPYLGEDAVQPFLARADRGAFLLARTSNRSARDLQDLSVGDCVVYERVAQLANQWNADHPGTCGLVVGATYPRELARLREIAPTLPFLIPGVGAQGGDLAAAAAYGPTAEGLGPLINSSRGVIFASDGPDFAEAARAAASTLRTSIYEAKAIHP